MLKDRRLLLEQEIRKTHDQAATMYLSIALSDGDIHDNDYQLLRSRIADLQFELDMVNRLILNGHA